MLLNWRVYYSDGSTFDNFQGKPEDAPKTGVQVVNVRDGRHGRRVLKLVDYYIWAPSLDRWLDAIDSASLVLRASREPYIVVLFGEYLKESEFEKILIHAHNDPEFPAKYAGKPHEAWGA